MVVVYSIMAAVILLGVFAVAIRRRMNPKVLAERLSAGKVKALEYTLLAISVCAWGSATFLMIGGHVFGDNTTGMAVVSFMVGLGCWTTFRDVRMTRIRRFRMEL